MYIPTASVKHVVSLLHSIASAFLFAFLGGVESCTESQVSISIADSFSVHTTMSAASRKQAPRLARPAARYWKGKAPKGVADAPSDSDEEDEPEVEEEGDVLIGGDQDIVEEDDVDVPTRKDPAKAVKSMNVSLRDVNISKDGKVTVAGREESGRTALEDDGNLLLTANLYIF